MNIVTMGIVCLFGCVMLAPGSSEQESAGAVQRTALHTHNEFNFTVQAPMTVAAPFFGANEERKWAEGWNPKFLKPNPVRDEQGAVFTIAHPGGADAIWVMTAADFAGGHIQYVYVIPDAMATLIDIHLTQANSKTTAVHVVYERTALRPEGNAHVEHFAKNDGGQGPEWADAINGYLKKNGGK